MPILAVLLVGCAGLLPQPLRAHVRASARPTAASIGRPSNGARAAAAASAAGPVGRVLPFRPSSAARDEESGAPPKAPTTPMPAPRRAFVWAPVRPELLSLDPASMGASEAVQLECRLLTEPERLHVAGCSLAVVLLLASARLSLLSAPKAYILLRAALELVTRRLRETRSVSTPEASRAAAVASASFFRSAALGSAAWALALTGAAVWAWCATGALVGYLLDRRANALALARGQASASPHAASAERPFWFRRGRQHGAAAASHGLLAVVELLWACEAAALTLTYVAERLVRSWLPSAVRYLVSLDYEAGLNGAKGGMRDAAASVGAALANAPEFFNYQANVRGLQFENFLADSWASWLKLRAKWLRESGGRSSRSRGGKGRRAQAAGGSDLEWVREAFDSALQSTMTSAKSGWVRWQLSSLSAKKPARPKTTEHDGGADATKPHAAKPHAAKPHTDKAPAAKQHAADASPPSAKQRLGANVNASQPRLKAEGDGGLGGLSFGSLSFWRPFGQQPAVAEPPLASSGSGAQLAPQAGAAAVPSAANSTAAPAATPAAHLRGMDSATTALDGSPLATLNNWFANIFAGGAQQAAVAESAEREAAPGSGREVDAEVVLEADSGAAANDTARSDSTAVIDSVLVVPFAADGPRRDTTQ